jgi:hypothetical protein
MAVDFFMVYCHVQFLSHPVLSDLLTDEDQKAGFFSLFFPIFLQLKRCEYLEMLEKVM